MEKRPIGLDQILLFGDSITQYSFDPFANGFGAFLSHSYVRKCDVVNRGFSGYNTKWAKPLLPAVLDTTLPCASESNHPRTLLATVFLGANDACIPETHRQYVSLEEYAQNLKWMIDLLKSKDIQVLLITPPPVDPARWEAHCLEKGRALDRTVENTKKYRNACIHVAAENNVPYLDTWELFLGPNLEW
jgi:lysophospholipase L1-like esterase